MNEDEQTNNTDSAPDRSNERSSTRRTPRVGRTSDARSQGCAAGGFGELGSIAAGIVPLEEGGPRPA